MSPVLIKHCCSRPHIGETLTVNFLRHQLSHATLLVNYYLPDPPGTQEIDVVLLNHNGVYLLEVKHWLGPIQADQVHWRHSSGDLRLSPIPSIEKKAKIMHSFLVDRGWDNVSVVGLVVLSKGTALLEIDDPNEPKVFALDDNLVQALVKREYVHHPRCKRLSGSEIRRLRRTLLKTHVSDAARYVAGFQVLEERDREHYVELIAQDPEFENRKIRIKQYDVPSIGSQRELDQAVQRFKREMRALVEATPHPNLVMPYQFRRDQSSDERYYLILEWTSERTLADRITRGAIEQEEQRRLLVEIAAALAHCHGHKVYHRNLSPSSVYLISGNKIKVGDFDFARVPTVSRTLSQTTKRLMKGRHLAPEQALLAPDVDQRADIFSLGVIWYDMLFRPEPDAPINRDQIAQAPLSEKDKKLLQAMIEEVRSERPPSIEKIKEQLEALERDEQGDSGVTVELNDKEAIIGSNDQEDSIAKESKPTVVTVPEDAEQEPKESLKWHARLAHLLRGKNR